MKKIEIQKYMPMLSLVATVISIIVGAYTLRQFYLQNKRQKEDELIQRAKAA